MTVNEILLAILKLASVPLLVLFNRLFVAAEFALVKIRDSQLETLRVRKLAELTGQPLKETADASTVAGLVIQQLGRFPWLGDVLALDGSELRAEEIAGTRVVRMTLRRQTAQSSGPKSAETDAQSKTNATQRQLKLVA
jgi:CBS domain containing-hemolysin-like protein